MIINEKSLDLVYKGYQTVYTSAYMKAPVHWDQIAMQVSSMSAEETYGWMGQFPMLREWIGPRHVKSLEAYDFRIANRRFESTVRINRDHISDDKLGVFKPAFAEMGHAARTHPEELVFDLLASGFTSNSYDGQSFFDREHPGHDANGNPTSVSNMQPGTGQPWFLLDTSREVRPIVWQEREKYEFQRMDKSSDYNVFMNDEYIYGVRARVNAGFGLWQLAYASKSSLSPDNYAAARAAMMSVRSEEGRILGVKPTTLVVPPSLESEALHILNTEFSTGGGTNPWKNTAEMIVTPYLAA